MARQPNPYYADAGRLNPVNQGLTNLAQVGQMFLSGPDPRTRAATLSSAWDARRNREEVTDIVDRRGGRQQLGDVFAGYQPDTYDPRQVLGTALRSGAMDPEDLGTLFRVAAGNLPGMSDQQRAGAVIGAGGRIGPDSAFSIGDRESVAGRNAANEQALRQMREAAAMERLQYETGAEAEQGPTSRDELLTSLFMNEGPDAAGQARTALYGESGGASANPWLEATRRSNVEGDVETVLNSMIEGMGLESGAVPPELRTQIVREAMRGIQEGSTPTAEVGRLLQQLNVRAEDPGWFRDPRLVYDEAPGAPAAAAAPSDAEMPPVPGARRAPDGNWYVQQNGQWFRVD